MDDREEEIDISGYDSAVSFFSTKDGVVDPLSNYQDETQPSSFLGDNDGERSCDLAQKTKKRRVVKKKQFQENCLGIDVLPDRFRTAFSFQFFNRMQTEAFPTIYESEENCVVSSPTGSGKTVLFELAIMRLISGMNGATGNGKVLYIAPTKSLCCEKFKSWGPNFLGLSVGMLTSDTSFLETEKVKKCSIIVTTPEKWDLLTRKWKDYSRLFELVKLVLVDEVHTLRERRGATLEVVLTRMNLLCDDIRFIAVSATIPNVQDVAQWLGSKSPGGCAKILAFDDRYRQVKLEQYVYGCTFNNRNEFQHDSLFNLKLDEIITKHSKERAVLIFCPTRASTVSTAKFVAQHCSGWLHSRNKCRDNRFEDHNLASLIEQGVAFHHAGLSMSDRELVEHSFLNGVVKILCSTSTLAVGVNLPAYLVIIKGTRMWNASATQEYTHLDMLQMIGRAGRPQFEKAGCAVILTESSMKDTYEKLLLGTDELESALHLELIEHLAAEISLNTVYSPQSAITWLRNTYFYVRFKKNPPAYYEVNQIVGDGLNRDSQISHFVQNLLNILLEYRIIERMDDKLISTAYGHAMARHYVLFDSMKRFLSANDGQTPQDVLTLLAGAREFADIRVRQKEKRLYKEINNSPLLRFPYLAGGKQSRIIDASDQKVSLLIQYELGGLEYPNYSGAFALHQTMVQDKYLVFRHCFRLLKCMVDISVEKGDGISLKNALFLLRSVGGNCWEDSAMVLGQLKSVGLVSVRKLVQKGVRCLQDLDKLSDQQIESYLGLKIGNGSKIKRDVRALPQLKMECALDGYEMQRSQIIATFRVQISATFVSPTWHGQNLSIDVEVLKSSGKLLDFRKILLVHLASPRDFTVKAVIESDKDDVEFSMNCLEVAGIGEKAKFLAVDLISKCPRLSTNAPTEAQEHLHHGLENLEEAVASSPSSDDSILDYLNAQTDGSDSVRTSKRDTSKSRTVRPNGNFECYHSCRDKTSCRHLCCKEGIPVSCLRSRNALANTRTKALAAGENADAGITSKRKLCQTLEPMSIEPKHYKMTPSLEQVIERWPRDCGSALSQVAVASRSTSRTSREPTASSNFLSRSEGASHDLGLGLEFLDSDIELN